MAIWDDPVLFFCQIEAVETLIWLTEVAPKLGGARELATWPTPRPTPTCSAWRCKMATGSGKTTVMAMLIAWQTLNARAPPAARRFSDAFLIVAPGITIKDRLRVLLPNDPDNYYETRDLVPPTCWTTCEGEDRHHQLPRLQAAREGRGAKADARLLEGREGPDRSRRPKADAPARLPS